MASLGAPLDDWQEQVLECSMGERSDGRWAAKYVGLSAPRQNGKSQLIAARALAGALLFGEKTIIISAHEADTAREIWKRMLDIIESNHRLGARLSERIDSVYREYVSFGVGEDKCTIRLKARSKSGGRGFSCDCLLLDEAQILGKDTWGAINPTVSARPNPQVWLMGTPPTEGDDPYAFSRVRESSLKHAARHAYLEWSAEPDDDIDDPETWAKANPAFGVRISVEACEDDRANMDDDQFMRERLGMWDVAAGVGSVIPSQSWKDAADGNSVAADRLALGIEVGPDLRWASVSLAGQRADGDWHLELVEDQHTKGAGVDWLDPFLMMVLADNPRIRTVVVDVSSPIKSMIEQRGKRYWWKRPDGSRGFEVHALKVNELGVGCTSLLSGIVTGSVHHIGQPQLSAAALAAGKRALGDTGMWVWHRRAATSDITPIQSGTYALIGAQLDKPTPARRVSSRGSRSSGGRRAVVLSG